jgi:hypothetical protein
MYFSAEEDDRALRGRVLLAIATYFLLQMTLPLKGATLTYSHLRAGI